MGNELSLEEVLKVADKVPRWNNIRGYKRWKRGIEITIEGYKGYYKDVKVAITSESEYSDSGHFFIEYTIKCSFNGAETGNYNYWSNHMSQSTGGDIRISKLYGKISEISKNTASEDIKKRLNL